MKVNANNFLIWDDGNGETGLGPLTHGYWQDRNRCSTAIVAVPGEVMSFNLNTDTGLTLGTFSSLRLALVNSVTGAVVNANAGALVQHTISGLNYNVHATFVLPAAPKGLYHFQIKSGSTVLLSSNNFEVRNDNYEDISTFATFRHDRYFYGVPYGFDETFYQKFRLSMFVIDDQPESDREIYKEQTTGKRRSFKNDMDWIVKMETYYFSLADHAAAAVMFEHEELQLNDEDFVCKSTYRIVTDSRSKVSKGECELYNQTFASLNRCIT